MRQKSTTLDKLHTNALHLLTDDKIIEDEIVGVSEFELIIQEYIIKLDQWIWNRECDKDDVKADVSRTRKSARLQKFELKRFDGDPLEWHMFWDTFESTIDKDKSLDDVTKFNYLKSVLDGRAADCVKGVMLTSKNYRSACTILKDRFADPQVVITANMDVLIELNAVTSVKDVEKLRKLYDTIEIHACNLSTFDINSEHYADFDFYNYE